MFIKYWCLLKYIHLKPKILEFSKFNFDLFCNYPIWLNLNFSYIFIRNLENNSWGLNTIEVLDIKIEIKKLIVLASLSLKKLMELFKLKSHCTHFNKFETFFFNFLYS